MGKDDDDDLPESIPIQMVTETFSQVIVKHEENTDNESKNDTKK